MLLPEAYALCYLHTDCYAVEERDSLYFTPSPRAIAAKEMYISYYFHYSMPRHNMMAFSI